MLNHIQKSFPDTEVILRAPATIGDYFSMGITSRSSILDLLEHDIWPFAVGANKKYHSIDCATNFCFETYISCGITSARTMLSLRDDDITPFHIKNMLLREERPKKMNTQYLRSMRNNYYGRPTAMHVMPRILDTLQNHEIIYCIEGHKARYSASVVELSL
jgi:hypothetical protein